MGIGEYIVLAWIAIVVVIWLVVRRKKPNLIGIGKDRNKQRLDNIKLMPCQSCKEGFMEPKFQWWRYFFAIGIPPAFVYIIGQPEEYHCNNCNRTIKESRKNKIITRISLSQNLPIAYIITQLIILIVGGFFIISIGLKSLGF